MVVVSSIQFTDYVLSEVEGHILALQTLDHLDSFCSLQSPQLCLSFPTENSVVLCTLKLTPKRRLEILKEFPSSSKAQPGTERS